MKSSFMKRLTNECQGIFLQFIDCQRTDSEKQIELFKAFNSIKFFGELNVRNIFPDKVMFKICESLLENIKDDTVEALYLLLEIIG